MKSTKKRLFSRVAMTLAFMLLTTATAWAIKTETPVTYTVSYSNNYITIMNGSTSTASWSAKTSGIAHYWAADDSHNLSNGMTVKPSADVSVTGGTPATQTSTTFTFTAPSNIAITGVTFKMGNNNVTASSTSEPGTTFTVTLAATTGFNSFTVTYGNISGSCGGSATWSLAKENGQYTALTIGGSGAMSDYSGTGAPWGTDLTSATVGSDITAIGNNAFNGCTALTRVNVQKTDGLVTLSSTAFNGCSALAAIVAPTPALAMQYKTAANWSAYAAMMCADFGGYAFHIDGNTTADAAYAIATADDLNNLAAAVNENYSTSGLTFRQTADITFTGGSDTESNFTAIGNSSRSFNGTFDGQNHVIRGIRIYKGGTSDADRSQGLFGHIAGSGAKVKNVILADARITGYVNTGGIAGYNNGGTIENCHVLSDVTVHAVQSTCYNHGGIVGNSVSGTVTGCTSAAAVTAANGLSECNYYGGIAGKNDATVKDCIYLGTTVEGNKFVGAIVGRNNSSVQNCYYTDTNIRGKDQYSVSLSNANSAVGSGSGTVTNCGPAPRDAADNTGFISLMAARNTALTAHSHTPAVSTAVDVTLSGRTLYKDGAWNTLCLPFSMTAAQIAANTGFAGAEIRELSNASFDGSTLTLNFTAEGAVTSITAGVPCIVRWASGSNFTPTFSGVTIDATAHNKACDLGDGKSITFTGTYAPVTYADENKSVLFLGGEDKLYYPDGTATTTIGACRAYFTLDGIEAGNKANEVKAFVLNFGDDETGISLTPDPSPVGEGSAGAWYDLSGRKVHNGQLPRGIYVNNGKKVVIK